MYPRKLGCMLRRSISQKRMDFGASRLITFVANYNDTSDSGMMNTGQSAV